MNRILRRPMFRMGGTPNEGIMTGLTKPRVGYQMGTGPDAVTGITTQLPQRPGFFTKIFQALNPTTGEIVERAQRVEQATPLMERLFPANQPLEFRTEKEAEAFAEKNPNYPTPIKILETGKIINKKEEPKGGGDPTEDPDPTKDPKIKLDDKDLETAFKEILPIFKSELSADADEIKRERFLELAKFGANLAAQPGGSLTRAIGAAAGPSLDNLSKIGREQRLLDRSAKTLALEAALKQIDNPTLKQLKTLADASGMDIKDVARLRTVPVGAGNVKQENKELLVDSLRQSDEATDLSDKQILDIAEIASQKNLSSFQVQPLPTDKSSIIEGIYYFGTKGDQKGKLFIGTKTQGLKPVVAGVTKK